MTLSFGQGLLVSAEDTKGIPEETLNKFLKRTGAPDELISRWDYEQKLDIFTKGKKANIEFDTTNTVEFDEQDLSPVGEPSAELIEAPEDGGFTTMATIPSSKLQVSHDIFTVVRDNVKYKSVYAHYRWWGTKYKGTKNDKIAIAVPKGWSIRANSYACVEYQSGNSSSWGVHGRCSGRPYDLDFYGAVWNLTRTDWVYHKGWANLEMKRTSSSAQLKVLSKYIEDTGSSTTWSIGWGPMSVSINGNKESNQAVWDTSFTY